MGCWSNLVRHLVCTQEIGVQLPGGPLNRFLHPSSFLLHPCLHPSSFILVFSGDWRAALHRPWEPDDVGSNPTPLTGPVVQREDAGLACRQCGFEPRRVHWYGGQPDLGWPDRSAKAVLPCRRGGFNSLAFRFVPGVCRTHTTLRKSRTRFDSWRGYCFDAGARRPGNRLQPGGSGFDSHRRL